MTWTAASRSQALAMLEEGATYLKVAEALGVTRGAVAGLAYRARRGGTAKRGRRVKLSPEAVETIKTWLAARRPQWEIAYVFGVSQATISKIKRGKR